MAKSAESAVPRKHAAQPGIAAIHSCVHPPLGIAASAVGLASPAQSIHRNNQELAAGCANAYQEAVVFSHA